MRSRFWPLPRCWTGRFCVGFAMRTRWRSLERRGVIQLVADGSQTVARLCHPLLGEDGNATRWGGASRQLNGMLAQHLRKHLRPEEQRSRLPDVRTQIQLAQFMMRSDLAPDLEVIIDAAASAMTMSNAGLAKNWPDSRSIAAVACRLRSCLLRRWVGRDAATRPRRCLVTSILMAPMSC